ncbi:MAG: ferritin [Acidobacteriota bacterium]|jgi:ferritin
MLSSEKLIAAFNEQVGNELGASHQYLSIASYFDRENLPQLSEFFLLQAEEEREHALKFVHFINDIDGVLRIPEIEAPKSEYASASEAVGLALEWEHEVTEQIYRLVEVAREERHLIAQRFLDWFVTEQLEEVNTMSTLLGIIERAGEDGLLHVEDYLAREAGSLGPETE